MKEKNLNKKVLIQEQYSDTHAGEHVDILEDNSSGKFLIKNGLVKSCNKKFAELLGFRIDEIIDQKGLGDIIQTEDLASVENSLMSLIGSDANSTQDILRIRKKDDSTVKAQLNLSKTFCDGKLTLIGTVVEVSESKTIETPINILTQAVNNLNECIILTDLNRTIFYVNESLCRLLGYSYDELLGKNVNDVFKECTSQENYKKISLNSQQSNSQCKLVCCKKDGTHVLISLKNSLITDKKNSSLAQLYILNDISEKDKMMGELRRNEFKYRNLFEKMHDAFVFVKLISNDQNRPVDLIALEANKGFELLIKISREELIGKSILQRFNQLEDNEINILSLIEKAVLNGEENRFDIRAKNVGEWYSVSVYSPEKDYAFIILHDITREKKAQAESDQSKMMLKSILDNIPQRVFWKDKNSNYLGCNIHFANDMGLNDPSEIIGKSEFDFSPKELAESYIANDKLVIESGESLTSVEYEYQLPKNRNKIWVRLNKMPLKNFEGKIIGIVGTYEDISKQKNIEDNLRKLSQAVEQSPASIVITDTDGNIEYVNPKFSLVTGYSFQEVAGKNSRILKSGEMSVEVYKGLWQTISSGNEWKGEFYNKKKNGELYWERASISPIKDNDGVITHYLAVKEDITEKKRAEEVLQENERLLRETQAIAKLGSYVLDIPKGIWQSSTILDNIFGIDEQYDHSVEGWISLIHPEWREIMANYFLNDVLGQHTRFDKEYKIVRKSDGEERWVHGLGELVFDSNNQPIKMIGTIRDVTDRKLADDTLKGSFSLLEGTLESTVDGILVVDQNGKIQRFNKKFLEMWRIPDSVIETRNDDAALNFVLSQLKYPDQFLNKVKELYKDTKAESIDYLEFIDGRVFERFSRPQLIGNKTIGRVWSFRDITDRKIAEESLIASEKKFRTVVEEAVETVFTIDYNGYFTYVNPAGLKASGYSLDELKQLKYIDLIEKEYKQKVRRNYFRQYLERKELTTAEYPIKTKSGEIKWFNQNTRLIIENNEVKGFYVIARDVTERRKVEEALRESEEKFRTLFETSIEGILASDVNGKNVLVNQRMAEMTGYSVEELMNMDFEQLLPTDEMPDHLLKMEERMKGISSIYERRLLTKDGSTIWTLVSAAPILNKEGKFTGSFGVFTDITERKKMVEELVAAKEKAEETNRLKSIFLANISHELRTPLVGILGYAETLYNELENPEFKEMAHTLLTSSTRLKETLNLLLDLSHIEADKLDVNISRQNLTFMVREKFKQFHSAAKEKGLRFQLVLGEDDLFINADERMLSQVIEHLLANAIKYTSKGDITVTISKIFENQKQYAQLKVKDTGVGIPKQSSKVIFEPFRQASEGFSRSFEGLGIGLTVAKKFIDMMGGEISVESELGKGSEFTVKFPIDSRNKFNFSQNFAPEKLLDSQNVQKYKFSSEVLLIEDDEPTANIVKFYLSETCRIDWVCNAKTAIAMAEKKNYSAILVDINLGIGMDGIETINVIKNIKGYNSVPIVAVTAYALYGDREKFLKQGCTHYISKPFEKNDLVELVDKILAAKR
jgi:PAS domain S-box-containing protein